MEIWIRLQKFSSDLFMQKNCPQTPFTNTSYSQSTLHKYLCENWLDSFLGSAGLLANANAFFFLPSPLPVPLFCDGRAGHPTDQPPRPREPHWLGWLCPQANVLSLSQAPQCIYQHPVSANVWHERQGRSYVVFRDEGASSCAPSSIHPPTSNEGAIPDPMQTLARAYWASTGVPAAALLLLTLL